MSVPLAPLVPGLMLLQTLLLDALYQDQLLLTSQADPWQRKLNLSRRTLSEGCIK